MYGSTVRELEEAPGPMEFLREYVLKNIPFVVRGSLEMHAMTYREVFAKCLLFIVYSGLALVSAKILTQFFARLQIV